MRLGRYRSVFLEIQSSRANSTVDTPRLECVTRQKARNQEKSGSLVPCVAALKVCETYFW